MFEKVALLAMFKMIMRREFSLEGIRKYQTLRREFWFEIVHGIF